MLPATVDSASAQRVQAKSESLGFNQTDIISRTAVARGSNYRVWKTVTAGTNHLGTNRCRTNSYTELASGMNYRSGTEWLEANPHFMVDQSGSALGLGAMHSVRLAPALNTFGAVDLTTPGGSHLRSHVLAIYFHDRTSGQTVQIGSVQDAFGSIFGQEIVYSNAFSGVNADVRYRFKKSGLSQEIVFHDIPSPAVSNLDPRSTSIEVWTEFLDNPQSAKRFARTNDLGQENVHVIDFGDMRIGQGTAFLVHSGGSQATPSLPVATKRPVAQRTPVRKEWINESGRSFLVESLPYEVVRGQLDKLHLGADTRTPGSKRIKVAMARSIPPPLGPKPKSPGRFETASARFQEQGVVLDYEIINTSNEPTLLKGDTTYFITDNFYTPQLTIEGGAVIKMDANPDVAIETDTLTCRTESYHPAFITGVDDDLVGEWIDCCSTGFPDDWRWNGLTVYSSPQGIKNLNFKHLETALTLGGSVLVRDCQFMHCDRGFISFGGEVGVQNCLFSDVNISFTGEDTTSVNCQQTTFDGFGPPEPIDYGQYSPGVTYHNCIFTDSDFGIDPQSGQINGCYISADYNGFYSCPSFGGHQFSSQDWPFVTSGCGSHYLWENSPFRGVGTTSIDSDLLHSLTNKTTQRPIELPLGMTVSGELTLFPQIPRYVTGHPDLGYHYSALDYTATAINLAGKLTFQPGVALGLRSQYIGFAGHFVAYGFDLLGGSSLISRATPTRPIVFASTDLVQEEAEFPGVIGFIPDFDPFIDGEDGALPSLDFRFSKFYFTGVDMVMWSGRLENVYPPVRASRDSSMNLSFTDCEIKGGLINIGEPNWVGFTTPECTVTWRNNFFDRVRVYLDPTFWWFDTSLSPEIDFKFSAYNNLFRGWGIRIYPIPTSQGNWVFKDNLFDKVIFEDYGPNYPYPLDHDYNAYWPLSSQELDEIEISWGFRPFAHLPVNYNNLSQYASHDVVLNTIPPYQSGPFGDYYLATSSPLYDAGKRGSRSVADAGLYHFTSRPDQVKDGAQSGNIIMGRHYVATYAEKPSDYDSDGIPDYVENVAGDGQWHQGAETDWQRPRTEAGVEDASNAIYDDVDLSGDGLVGRIKKAFGSDPLASSNPLTLNPIPSGSDPDIVNFELPINYALIDYNSPSHIGKLALRMDGIPISVDWSQGANGFSRLAWRITFSPPGNHLIQAEFVLDHVLTAGPDPDPTIITAMGPLVPYTTQNGIQFDPFYSQYTDSHGPLLYATTPTCQNATYTIELKTISGAHIRTISGSTSNGEISEPWDLKNDQGNIIADSSVNAVFNVTLLEPSSYTSTFRLNRVDAKWLPVDGAFTVAYACDRGNDEQDLHDCIQLNVVDQLIGPCNATFCYDHPYNSTFNTWSQLGRARGNPGHLGNQADVDALLTNLGNEGYLLDEDLTKNFYFFGHGNPSSVGTENRMTTEVALYEHNVAVRLGNSSVAMSDYRFGQAYRLVFLDACSTADLPDWAHAFGVHRRITTKELLNWPEQVQAFVGWVNLKKTPLTGDKFDMSGCYSVFWSAWQNGLALDRCLWFASQAHPPAPINFMDLSNYNFGPEYQHWSWAYRDVTNMKGDPRLRIYGYAGITRSGYVLGYDYSSYYK